MGDGTPEHSSWRLGAIRRTGDGASEVLRWREVPDAEAEELQVISRLVRTVGSQHDFQGLMVAAQRWGEVIERIKERLTAGQPLPRALVTDANLEMVALGRATQRCEQGGIKATQLVRSHGYGSADLIATVEKSRRFMHTQQWYLACLALTPDAHAGELAFTLSTSEVWIDGLASLSAADFGLALVGQVGTFVGVCTAECSEALAEPARKLKALLSQVPDGVVPNLVRLRGDGNPAPSGANFATLAIPQAVALLSFVERLSSLTPEQFAQAQYEVIGADTRQQIAFGAVNVSAASESATATNAVNDLPHAKVTLDVDLLGSAPVDFWTSVTFDVIDAGAGQRLFAGAVQSATGNQILALDCEGGVELIEHNRGSIAAAGVLTEELIATLMRQAGVPPETLVMSSPDDSPKVEELFDVFVPIRGLSVEATVSVGSITIVPIALGHRAVAALDLSEDHLQSLVAEFQDADAYATTSVTADALDAAQELGYREIETAIAWLVARQRYGRLRIPDGTAQSFSRAHALQTVRYAPVVTVRGQTTGRQWLMWVHDVIRPEPQQLSSSSDLLRPQLPADLSARDERALRGVMRAVNEPTVQQQVHALTEALENYVAGVSVPGPFSKQQINDLRALEPDWLNNEQRRRFAGAIKGMKGSTFVDRLDARLRRDGVPLTDDEHSLLFDTLRRARNDVAHGREIKNPPTPAQILLVISVVSRAIMFSIAEATPGE